MKPLIRVVIMIFLLLAFSSSGLVQTGRNLDNLVALEAFFDGLLVGQMQQYKVPGATLAVVKDGEVVLTKGYGFADLSTNKMVESDTLFRAGSVSKLVIWTAVMQLVEQGKLDLAEDINAYIDFQIPSIEVDQISAEPITLMHLMNHTAGFEDKVVELFVPDITYITPFNEYIKQDIPARVFTPGTVGAYSNYGAALAAYIVESVSGLSFADYAWLNIFQPLGMDNSTFEQPVPDLLANRAQGYAYLNGEYVVGDFEYVQAYPVGGLSTTALDMAKFMLAHLNQGRVMDTVILQPETIQLMHSQSFSHRAEFLGMAHGFFESKINGYRVLSHGGDTFLFHSGLFLIPEGNVGVFVSYNGISAAYAREELFHAFMERYFPGTTRRTLAPSVLTVEDAKSYKGNYVLSRNNFTTFESIIRLAQPIKVWVNHEGYLMINFPGGTEKYAQVGPGLFQELESGVLLGAVYNDAGKVTQFHTEQPYVILRVPFYATLWFSVLLILGNLLFFIFSIFNSIVYRKWSLLARCLVALHTIVFMFFLGLLANILLDNHPAYGVPNFVLNISAKLDTLLLIPWVLLIITVSMMLITVRTWINSRWRLGHRIHYTLLTLGALSLNWLMWYWNVLN